MPPAPQILAEMNAETLDAASAIHPSPAVRLIREFGTGALAGVAAGALAGLASRIVMRISGFAAGPGAVGELTESGFVVGEVTLGGTLALVLLGAIGGALGGAVYVAMRPWLAPLHRWRGIGFGLLMLAVSGEPDPASRDFRRFGPPLVSIAMFAALSPLAGALLVPLVTKLERYVAAPDPSGPSSSGRAAVHEVSWIAGIGTLLVLGLGGVIALFEVGALALLPVAMLALAFGTRFYLAYAGDRTSLAVPLRITTTVLIVAVVTTWFVRTASGIAEVLR